LANKKPTTVWVKGQSGNPKGRPPKGQAFADLLHELLEEDRNGKTTRRVICEKVVEHAVKGDMHAIQWVVDRTDGKLKDEHTGELIVRVLRDRAG
jgi:hypothetical protein